MSELLFHLDWVVPLRSDGLTWLFQAVSPLGSNGFAVLFLAVGLWFGRRRTFGRLIVACAFSEILNAHLKAFHMAPRPESYLHLVDVMGWSFPSGHAQHGTVMWLWLAFEIGEAKAWIPAMVIASMIALSRVYLGVHFVRDIVAGAGAGVMMLAYFRWLFTGSRRKRDIALFVGFQLVWVLLAPSGSLIGRFLPTAVLTGFAVGRGWERRVGTRTRPVFWWSVAATILVFGAGLVTETGGARPWLGPLGLGVQPLSVFLQFGLIGVWMGSAAPIVFRWLEIRNPG